MRYWVRRNAFSSSAAFSKCSLNNDEVTILRKRSKFSCVKSLAACASVSSPGLSSARSATASSHDPSPSLKSGGSCRWSPTRIDFLARIIGMTSSGGVALLTSSTIATSKRVCPTDSSVHGFSVQVTPTMLHEAVYVPMKPILSLFNVSSCSRSATQSFTIGSQSDLTLSPCAWLASKARKDSIASDLNLANSDATSALG